jgi:hypothetical protein
VFVVADGDTRVAATTGPEPTAGLVFYDLKSALRSIREQPAPRKRRAGPKKDAAAEPRADKPPPKKAAPRKPPAKRPAAKKKPDAP